MKKLSARRKRLSLKALCVLAVVFSGIFAVVRLFGIGGRPSMNSLTELDTGWYRLEAGSAVPVSPGEKIPFGEDGTVTLYLPVSSDGTITTRSALYRVRISLDGTKVYCYDDASIPRAFWRIIGSNTDNTFLIAALVHDVLCENHKFIDCDKNFSTEVFNALLEASSVCAIKRCLMKHSVNFYQNFCKWNSKEFSHGDI